MPAWEMGAKAVLGLKKGATAAAASKAWTLSADGDELMDDNELLTKEDAIRPAVAGAH